MKAFRDFRNRIVLYFRNWLLNSNVIGKNVTISQNVILKGAVLRGNVQVGTGCKLAYVVVDGRVKIGKNTSIWGPNVTIQSQINDVTIGNYCSIAKNVTIQENNHNVARFTTYYLNKNVLKSAAEDNISKGSIKIGHDVWIGDGAKVLSGVNIGTGAIIGANSVVTKDVPPYSIVVGVPGRVIKYRFGEATIAKLLDSQWWEFEKDELAENLPKLDHLITEHGK